MSEPKDGYNGWTNYETWNVALWIGNDESLQNIAREIAETDYPKHGPYERFVEYMREVAEDCGGDSSIGVETPDRVAWNDSGLDHAELDTMMRELAE